MPWREILLAFIRCELTARYAAGVGWRVTAKGALPVVIVAVVAVLALS